MRILALLTLLLLSSCTAWNRSNGSTEFSTPLLFAKPSPAPPDAHGPTSAVTHEDIDRIHSTPAAPPTPDTPRAEQALLATAVHRTTANGISLTTVTFDDRLVSLEVADKAGGPATEWQSAQAAAKAHGALAAINASFFTPEGDPLGLVIEHGRRFGSWSTGSSLTSGVLAVTANSSRLVRRQRWAPSSPASHLVQAGPFLLENGAVVPGLSERNSRPRCFLAWDGGHHWALGHARSATLDRLAAALATQPIPGKNFDTVLNLDGGRSSDLWVGTSVSGGPVSTRTLWNKPVRNYVLIRPRTLSP